MFYGFPQVPYAVFIFWDTLFFCVSLVGWILLSCLQVLWYSFPLRLVHCWTPLRNYSVLLLYSLALCFLFGIFLHFLSLCWNSHFVHVMFYWLQWSLLWPLFWTFYQVSIPNFWNFIIFFCLGCFDGMIFVYLFSLTLLWWFLYILTEWSSVENELCQSAWLILLVFSKSFMIF